MDSSNHLSSTSALVLLMLQGEIHTSMTAKKYLARLDLSEARPLYEKSIHFWPHYPSIIKNRKHCIRDVAYDSVMHQNIKQIVLFGAGYDALSLEVTSWSHKCKIFEIDIANMDAKSELLCSLDSSLAKQITCIALDAAKPDGIIPALDQYGYDQNAPVLVIFEGISYYIPKKTLWGVIEKFSTPTRQNKVVLEYLLYDDKIAPDSRSIANYIFGLIASDCNLDEIVRYDMDEIGSLIRKTNGNILHHHTMQQMEERRDAPGNRIFTGMADGWIEICEFSI